MMKKTTNGKKNGRQDQGWKRKDQLAKKNKTGIKGRDKRGRKESEGRKGEKGERWRIRAKEEEIKRKLKGENEEK